MFKNRVFYRVLGPSAAENFILAMLKKRGFFQVFLLCGKENHKQLYRKIF